MNRNDPLHALAEALLSGAVRLDPLCPPGPGASEAVQLCHTADLIMCGRFPDIEGLGGPEIMFADDFVDVAGAGVGFFTRAVWEGDHSHIFAQIDEEPVAVATEDGTWGVCLKCLRDVGSHRAENGQTSTEFSRLAEILRTCRAQGVRRRGDMVIGRLADLMDVTLAARR